MKKPRVKKWYVYILECGGGRLYTGMTNDVAARFAAHKAGKGARFTRAFGVRRLVYREKLGSRSLAMRREAEIKGWGKTAKRALITGVKKTQRIRYAERSAI